MTKKEESQLGRERQVEQRASGDRRVAQRRRPDEALTRELQEILIGDPELDASEIDVEVEGGAVTLRGTVDSGDAKLLAEELVESVTGVREVHNQLKVAR
jgi:osmotically-inducible protein OsmY